jgi:hypothetical protein
MPITFQAERLIGRLNAIQATQIKYAGTQAMRKLGFEMRRELGQYMTQTFNGPVPFTINSALYRDTGGLSVGISINPSGDEKGQSPASYLFPLTKEGAQKPLQTRFNKALRLGAMSPNMTALYWLPDAGTPTRNGSTEPGFLKAILTALSQGGSLKGARSKYGTGGAKYFINPDMRSPGKQARHLAPGIYRVKGNSSPERLMGLALTSRLRVPTNFDFPEIVRERSAALLPGILRSELDRAMR